MPRISETLTGAQIQLRDVWISPSAYETLVFFGVLAQGEVGTLRASQMASGACVCATESSRRSLLMIKAD